MAERKCKNWLDTFEQWTLPRSEAPRSFIYWTGLFTLATVVKRHTCIPKSLLGSWSCYPNLYVMFVSPPAEGRKTTTMDYTDELLDDIPNIHTIPQAITQADLMKRLSEIGDSSVAIRSKEFGTFFNQSGYIMIDFLTLLFDGQKKFDSSTVMRSLELAEKPCVNLLAATTPLWIANNLSEVMIGGGFTSRCIFVYEEGVRRLQLFYANLNVAAFQKLRDNLIEDLTHITTNINGDFHIDEDLMMWFEHWYQSEARRNKSADERIRGYLQRKPAHIMKVAQLLHIAYSDELEITREDLDKAIKLVTHTEKNLPKVFQTVGQNPFASVAENIAEYIETKGVVGKREILSRFYHAAPMDKLLELLSSLVIIGRIKLVDSSDSNMMYASKSHQATQKHTDTDGQHTTVPLDATGTP